MASKKELQRLLKYLEHEAEQAKIKEYSRSPHLKLYYEGFGDAYREVINMTSQKMQKREIFGTKKKLNRFQGDDKAGKRLYQKEVSGTKKELNRFQGDDKAGKRLYQKEVFRVKIFGVKKKDPTEVGHSKGKKVRY